MNNILIVFGTRPEVIKLYPLIKSLGKYASFRTVFTGQHAELTNQILLDLKIQPNYRLEIMKKGQSLTELTSKLHEQLNEIYKKEKPDLVIVQGDTTTALVGALEAYYNHIPVAHVEAGVRSHNIYAPFPEEVNRRIISSFASYHFCPTEDEKSNLEKENIIKNVFVTGNTGIDTLLEISNKTISTSKCQVLTTLHRRESFGKPIQSILDGLDKLLKSNPEWKMVIPVHLNPGVKDVIYNKFGKNPQVKLLQPLSYTQMVKLMMESAFIITDSGGIQEEAPSLNKPVLVARNETDRPQTILNHSALLVGTDGEKIFELGNRLINDRKFYESFINKNNPYGDGHAGERIIANLL